SLLAEVEVTVPADLRPGVHLLGPHLEGADEDHPLVVLPFLLRRGGRPRSGRPLLRRLPGSRFLRHCAPSSLCAWSLGLRVLVRKELLGRRIDALLHHPPRDSCLP